MSAATEHVNVRLQVALPNRTSRRRNTMKRESIVVIVNAIIWGLVLIASALALKGTGAFKEIQHIPGGGAVASLLVVGAGFRRKPHD
jgi:hypothetical protein